MSKILVNEIANYGDNAPIEVKEGINIAAGKPLQANGIAGSLGQVLTSTGITVNWTTPFDGNYNSLTNLPTIPAAQVKADWLAVGGIAEILNKPVVPAQPSIVNNGSSGGGSLSYNPVNGEFTYQSADLAPYALASAIQNSGGWDAAYSWGDHAGAGYLTAETDPQFTTWYTTNGISGITTTTINQWNTAYGWGDHGTQGYLTSYTETDPVFAASDAAAVTAAKISNWDTSYGWGDHSTQGYITGLGMEGLGNVDISGGISDQQVLKWDSASSSWKPANDLVGGQSAIELVDLSVSNAIASGGGNLSYNNTNGVFTYTPPELSTHLTDGEFSSAGLMTTDGVGAYTITTNNATEWDAAYSWGDHAAAGYLTAETDPTFTAHVASGILQQNITNWNTAYGWGNHASAGYATTTQLNTAVANSANWDLAYGWGDHSLGGYLTSYTETDPVFSASAAGGIVQQNIINWNTSHGWGDHSVAGYLTSLGSINGHTDVTITNPTNGQVIAYNNGQWINSSSALIANATISDTAPGSPANGDLWWESDKGRLKVYYNDTDSNQWVDASPPLAQPNVPVAAGFITLNGTSPTWTGTTGYTVSGTQPGGAGTDYVITLTFPTAYSARTDYIVQATYDGTNYIGENGASIGVARGTSSVVFTPRRWDENPLSTGEIMITITNL